MVNQINHTNKKKENTDFQILLPLRNMKALQTLKVRLSVK